jgi:hypothetical protein
MTKTRCTHKTKNGAQCKGKYWAMCGAHRPSKKKRGKRKTTKVSNKKKKGSTLFPYSENFLSKKPARKKKKSGRLALPIIAQTVGYTKPGPKKKVSKGMTGRMGLDLIASAYK